MQTYKKKEKTHNAKKILCRWYEKLGKENLQVQKFGRSAESVRERREATQVMR